MVACVEPALGFFFRINTKGHWPGSLPLRRIDHPFLDHDSYLECRGPLELDDYVVNESLRDRGIIGAIAATLAPTICALADEATTMSIADKDAIRTALGCPR